MREEDYWALLDEPGREVPVAELVDVPRRRARARARRAQPVPRARKVAAGCLAAALVVAGVVVTSSIVHGNRAHRGSGAPHVKIVKTDGGGDGGGARLDVLAALDTTTASGSFTIHYRLSSTPGANQTVTGDGVVHVDPTAIVTTTSVSGVREVTTRVDSTNVWQDGGANYEMASASTGPGWPLSQFATSVSGTLGRREGAIAMTRLASPTGYLDIAKQAITATSKLGSSTVAGVAVQRYAVTIDTMKALDVPGLTSEEITATTAALAVLRAERYTTTTVQLSIDASGFVRRAQTVVHFADGGTVDTDTTFSDFGCSSVVLQLNGPSIVPDPSACSPTSTTAGSPTPTTAGSTAP